MKRLGQIALLFFCGLLQLSGCSIAPYPTGDISKNPSIVYVDVNNPIFGVEPIRQGQVKKGDVIATYRRVDVIPKIELGTDKTFSAKYHRSSIYQAPNVCITVEFPNGRKYPAYLDTGFNGVVLLTSDIVLDNKLAIWPYMLGRKGVCHIPEFKIGFVKTKDIVAYYLEQQWQLRIINIPISKYPLILLGLKFIESFDYVLFDNVNREAVFAKDEVFEPDVPESWISFPFSIANEKMMVQMPINGQEYEVVFDSCGGRTGLLLNKSQWQVIKQDLTVERLVNTHVTIFQGARWPCKKVTVSEISIGEKILKNADVLIYDDSEGLSMMSLGYFQDTVVVLDLVNNLLWIKKLNGR